MATTNEKGGEFHQTTFMVEPHTRFEAAHDEPWVIYLGESANRLTLHFETADQVRQFMARLGEMAMAMEGITADSRFCRCCGTALKASDHCPACQCEEFHETCAGGVRFDRNTGRGVQ